MHRSLRHAAVTAALVTTLGACSSTPYKGLTKAAFIKQANAGCAHESKEGKAVNDLIAVTTDPEKKAQLYIDRVLPLFDREIDRIAKLKPPKADRDAVKKMLDQAREDSKDFAKALKDDPETALSPAAKPLGKSGLLAHAYGLKFCAD
jgi:hypothetical protein